MLLRGGAIAGAVLQRSYAPRADCATQHPYAGSRPPAWSTSLPLAGACELTAAPSKELRPQAARLTGDPCCVAAGGPREWRSAGYVARKRDESRSLLVCWVVERPRRIRQALFRQRRPDTTSSVSSKFFFGRTTLWSVSAQPGAYPQGGLQDGCCPSL